jgi:hypothetical protein
MDETLQNRLRNHKARRNALLNELTNIKQKQALPVSQISKKHIEAFCSKLYERLQDRNSCFGKQTLKLLVKEILFTGKWCI